jgi:hypothetical protein
VSAGSVPPERLRGEGADDHILDAVCVEARSQLIAAAERDPADRGLDADRDRARADVLPAPVPAASERQRAERAIVERAQAARAGTSGEIPCSSVAELVTIGARIERRLSAALRGLQELPVMSDVERERADAADRMQPPRRTPRLRGIGPRSSAWRLSAPGSSSRRGLTNSPPATTRGGSRTVPGLLRHRAAAVEQAAARRQATAARWNDTQLPDALWSDEAVRHSAEAAVDRIVRPEVNLHAARARSC